MLSRRTLLAAASSALFANGVAAAAPARKRGVMLMNRIGPSSSELHVANADGSGEPKLLRDSTFEYHASWSPDGQWVVFTSERHGDGQSDIFRARADGTGVEPLVTGPSMDDAGALSPDGTRLAFVSTREGYLANIWLLDLTTRRLRNLTQGRDVRGDPNGPDCYFRPSWSPDGQWIAFGVGSWFQERAHGKAVLFGVRADGTGAEALTDGAVHSGFPSYSADGRSLVYRVWGEQDKGLRILDLQTRQTRVLTEEYDNLPGWSPDGKLIVFTRKTSATNFDVFTIQSDGTDARRLTTSGANDGHAIWTADGRIAFNTGMYGFRDEAALYDATFQPYGQIMLMNADGSDKRMLTDSLWEDSMPLYLPSGG